MVETYKSYLQLNRTSSSCFLLQKYSRYYNCLTVYHHSNTHSISDKFYENIFGSVYFTSNLLWICKISNIARYVISNEVLLHGYVCMYIIVVWLFCRCVPLPEDNLCRKFGIDAYAIDVSSKPEVVAFQNMVVALVEDYRIIQVCTPFLNSTRCGVLYIPCNSTIHKLLPICETDCEQFSRATEACIHFLNENTNNLAVDNLITAANAFNCSNPATYVQSVNSSLYSSQETCREYVYDINITTQGTTVIAVIYSAYVFNVHSVSFACKVACYVSQ